MNTRLGGAALAALASLATVLALVAAPPLSPAAGAPTGDCAVPYPVADLTPGDAVHGLTVSTGTTPDPFTGEVLGVITDGIAPGIDMVMVRLTSTEIDRVGGIWAGMSGSPVYAADERLIGAVSYGLAFGPSPVAGVTPFAAMDDYAVPAPRVPVNRALARALAGAAGATPAQARQGFAQLPVPGGVSGVSALRLGKVRHRPYRDRSLQAWPVGRSAAAGPETLVAGGNLAVTMSYGDVLMGGVGTVTSTCDGRVIGFGHPMGFLGTTTEVMHPADAVYVQEDPVSAPFKVANPGLPAGTITDDHTTGVTGTVGLLPDTLDVRSTVSYGGHSRTGVTHVAIQRVAADATYYALAVNHDRVVDGQIPGTSSASWTIRGHRGDGTPFTVRLGQTYVSNVDITGQSIWDIPDEMYLLSQFPGVTLDRLVATSDVTDAPAVMELTGVEARWDGSWHAVGPGDTVSATAGTTLRLRLVLTGDSGGRRVPVGIDLPERLSGTSGKFRVQPGQEVFSLSALWDTQNLAQFLRIAKQAVRSDQAATWVESFRGDRRVFDATVLSVPAGVVITSAEDHSYELVIR